jgi:hypothetical protein
VNLTGSELNAVLEVNFVQYAKQLAIKAVTMPEDSKAPCY